MCVLFCKHYVFRFHVLVSVYVSCVRGFAVCAPARLPHCTVLSARPDRQIWCASSRPPYSVGSQSAARLEHVQPPCWTQTHLISYIRQRPRGGRPTDKARISTSRAATIAPRPSHITLNRPYSPSCVANRHISHHLASEPTKTTRMSPPHTPRSELSRRANTARSLSVVLSRLDGTRRCAFSTFT